ncbi:hypothetical protein AX16_007192 [Volvariella volvacea WC 439]|nr:hypothetical protein AX16_007192 [Volvariella volvacea WC 439]
MAQVDPAPTRAEVDRVVQEYSSTSVKYLKFAATPRIRLPQRVPVHGSLQAPEVPPPIARLTAHTEGGVGHSGTSLGFIFPPVALPEPLRYDGTLEYTSWEDLKSASNEVLLYSVAPNTILVKFMIGDRLVGVIDAKTSPSAFMHGFDGKFDWN